MVTQPIGLKSARVHILLVAISIGLTVVIPGTAAEADKGSADRIYLHGTILTMDARKSVIEAVAVLGGKILATGSEAEIRRLTGPKTVIEDLHGGTMLPGFYAAHDHFPSAGTVELYSVKLYSPPVGKITCIADIQSALRAKAEATPKGKWITGRGYDDTLLREMRHPTRADLDEVSTNHPIWIVHSSGHLGVANSRALELAGITRDSPKTTAGVIRRDPLTREPNGVIEENGLLVSRHIPGHTKAERFKAIEWCDHEYASKGVTTAVIAGTTTSMVLDLAEAQAQSVLHLRIVAMLSAGPGVPPTVEAAAKLSPDQDRIRVGAVKILQDGSIQGYTGFLSEPYFQQPEGKSDYRGYAHRSRQSLVAMVAKYHQAGYQVAIHANGDAAIEDVLAAYAAAARDYPRPETRHRIEHCQTARPDQLIRMKELGITPSFFDGHVYYWGDRHRDIFLGPERAARISPLHTALADGLHFTLHNDTPVTPVDPLLLVWAAVNRVTLAGKVLGPEERIGVYEALRAVTADAAWQNFEEAKKGTIEKGKLADFVVLAENPLTGPPMTLKELTIQQTIVGGESVYRSP